MAACTSCGERIIFAKTAQGKTMPLDELPNATKGNVHLVENGPKRLATVLGKAKAAEARAAGELLYLPHWVTCPFANRHRRNKR